MSNEVMQALKDRLAADIQRLESVKQLLLSVGESPDSKIRQILIDVSGEIVLREYEFQEQKRREELMPMHIRDIDNA